jgi:tRNA (cytidine32/guanosine34-2'-O)-methyltransferase
MIFLSPMDPRAEMLRSQLQLFFPDVRPPTHDAESSDTPSPRRYEEFDEDVTIRGDRSSSRQTGSPCCHPGDTDVREVHADLNPDRGTRGVADPEVFETPTRGGVWVRKPRSSRKGSGGE